MMTYSILTWDMELEHWTPQEGVPHTGLTIHELRRSMRLLQEQGYPCHRRGPDRESNCDAFVLIEAERSDNESPLDILQINW